MSDGTCEVRMKKLPVIFISLLLIVSSLWAQQTKMFVKVDRAIVYAEPSENSYKIDTVRSGTVLTLFEKGIESSEWIYVTFESRRWKGKVTGFIKAELVFTEEEMLKEEQRRMEEETPVEVATEAEEATEAEVKAKAGTKPQEELPDLKAAFAKKKPKPPPPVVTVTDGITESPQGRTFALPQTGEMVEMKPYAIIKKEFKPPPPPPLPPPEEEIPDVGNVKVEEIPPEQEEKEILEETPQAKEIVTPEAGIAEEEEFKKPEPPPPIVTVKDGITESSQGRVFALTQTAEMAEMKPYAIIKKEFKPPPSLLKAEEKIEKEAQAELLANVMPVKTEEPPPKEEEIPDEEKGKEEEKEILEETPQSKEIVAPDAGITEKEEEPQTIKPPEQVVKPTELPQIKQPDEMGLLSFGFGYGPSWGGFGGAIQVNVKDNISIHIGAGLYPTKAYYSEHDWATNEWLYSIGIKYYLPFGSMKLRTYVDLMYGGICVEAVQLVNEIWYYEYTYENIQKTLYGPSLVAGAEWKLGFYALNVYLGLSYNTTAWDYWDRDYFLNGGLGFSLYF